MKNSQNENYRNYEYLIENKVVVHVLIVDGEVRPLHTEVLDYETEDMLSSMEAAKYAAIAECLALEEWNDTHEPVEYKNDGFDSWKDE